MKPTFLIDRLPKDLWAITHNGSKPFTFDKLESLVMPSWEDVCQQLGIKADVENFYTAKIEAERERQGVLACKYKVPNIFLDNHVHDHGLLLSDGKIWFLLEVPKYYNIRGSSYKSFSDGKTITRILCKGVVRSPKPAPYTHMTGRMANYLWVGNAKQPLVTFREKLHFSPPTALWSLRVIHRYLDFANKATLFGSPMRFQASCGMTTRIVTKSRIVVDRNRSATRYESDETKARLGKIVDLNRGLPLHGFQDTDTTPWTNAMSVLRQVHAEATQRFIRSLANIAVLERGKVVFKFDRFFKDFNAPLLATDVAKLEAVGFTVLRTLPVGQSHVFKGFESREVAVDDGKGKFLHTVKTYPDGCWELPLLQSMAGGASMDAHLLFQYKGCFWLAWWGSVGCKLGIMPDRDLKPPKDFRPSPWWDTPLVDICG